ncbi:MAG TPA: hypothetical protein ENK46_08425 [Flavobacteriia bacterium]|jgi:hypothetical protein|nr:hypothetical protein [Flavobacteriia bacterium]
MNETLLAFLIVLVYFSPLLYQLFLVIKEYKLGNKKPLKNFRKYLKYSLIILFPIVVVFLTLSHTNYLNYEKPMTYDKIDQITFENFRGLEFFKKSLYGNKHFAYIVTSIDSKIDDKEVTVQSYFYPSRSYVYNSHVSSKELLSHELYHFKITELFVRKAKKEIAALNEPSKERIKSIIERIIIEKNKYQAKYDYDTFHSYVFSEQKKYEKRVDSLLNLLSKFKNPKIQINVKN